MIIKTMGSSVNKQDISLLVEQAQLIGCLIIIGTCILLFVWFGPNMEEVQDLSENIPEESDIFQETTVEDKVLLQQK